MCRDIDAELVGEMRGTPWDPVRDLPVMRERELLARNLYVTVAVTAVCFGSTSHPSGRAPSGIDAALMTDGDVVRVGYQAPILWSSNGC